MSACFHRVIPPAFLTAAILMPASLWGWGNTGHEAVACVAWQQLSDSAKKDVMVLLKKVPSVPTSTGTIPGYSAWVKQLPPGLSKDERHEFLFMRAATWADSIKHHGLQDSDTPPAGMTTDIHQGFSDRQSHGYWHFIDTGFGAATEHPPATPVPNVAVQIVALRDFLASDEAPVLKAYDLVWLEHLVGDVHQPLHASVRFVGGSGDRGGNGVNVKLPLPMEAKFKCPPSRSTPRELHAFWDDLPGSCPADTGLTAAAAFAKDLPLLLTHPELDPHGLVADDDPSHWAAESMNLAQTHAYADPIGAGVQPDDGTPSFVMTQAYYDRAIADAKDRVALAGARLAKLLNDTLQ